ncbi:hypothetical protein GQ44DRAFT_777700 [Phaeosphaeriaceae sp. PMI808]|nr:hypothetical protein GQ44DRAFT_777700 [Phaeosphaeriaceae sp. PMI808]
MEKGPPPPGGNTTNTTPGIVGISCLLTITLIVYGVRMYARIRPTFKLAAPDYIVSLAFLCEVAALINLFMAISVGFGRDKYYLSPGALRTIFINFFALGFAGFWASSLARMSIGSMLLRLEVSNNWRVVLKVLTLAQLFLPMSFTFVALFRCRPIRAMWEHVDGGVCWSGHRSRTYGFINSGIGIVSDLVFAIMPLYFIWSLHRPVMEKILISILMTLGTFAAMVEAYVVYRVAIWNTDKDPLKAWVPVLWWYRVEEIVLITAACTPFLKPLVERILGRFSAPQFRFRTMELNTFQSGQGAAPENVAKMGSSKQSTNGEQNSIKQTPSQATDRTSTDRLDGASDVRMRVTSV